MDAEEPYSIEIEDRGVYLYVLVGGLKVTSAIALDYWQDIVHECEAKSCSKILLDHNFEEMISMQEMVEVIGPIGEMMKGRKFAFYDRYGHYDIPEAGKAILRSHDVPMRIFHDLETAEKWLLAN